MNNWQSLQVQTLSRTHIKEFSRVKLKNFPLIKNHLKLISKNKNLKVFSRKEVRITKLKMNRRMRT